MPQLPERLLPFPLKPDMPQTHEENQRPAINSLTLAVLDGLHIQLGEYFSKHADLVNSGEPLTAGEIVHEIVSAIQTLGMPLPPLHHTYKRGEGSEGSYDEEKYALWTGDAADHHRHSKMLVILEYKHAEQQIYHLMIIDTTTEDVGNYYKLLGKQVVTDEVLDQTGTRTTREVELGVFESGNDQHVVTIFLDPDLFGSSGGLGERARNAA